MVYQFAIVDDNFEELKEIYELIASFLEMELIEANISTYHRSTDFPLESKFDVLFLDIDMPDFSGFELAKDYKKMNKDVQIIFVTNHKELVYEACNIHPFDFIRKENISNEICLVMEELLFKLQDLNPTISIEAFGTTYLIEQKDILFCESFDHKTEIHYRNSTLRVSQQLNHVANKINSINFFRVSRSYYVNMKKVDKLEGLVLYLHGNHQIQISRRKKSYIMKYLMEHTS